MLSVSAGGDDVSLCRSGSAPPTVEGALSAVGGLFAGDGDASESNGFPQEELLRADPAYASYYYSHLKLNPRLPSPVVSKEDWRRMQQLRTGGGSGLGGIGDRRQAELEDGGGRSLFSMQPGFGLQNGGRADARMSPGGGREWLERGEDGLVGLMPPGRQKSFAEMFQEDLGNTTPVNVHSFRPASRSTLNDGVELDYNGTRRALHHEIASGDGLQAGGNIQSVAGLQNIGGSSSHNFSSILGSSQSRSTTPDPQFVPRTPTPCLPPVGVRCDGINTNPNNGSRAFNSVSPNLVESDDILAALTGMNLLSAGAADADNTAQSKFQQEIKDQQNFLFDRQYGQNHNSQHPLLKNPEPSHLGMPSIPQSARSLHSDSANRFGGLMDSRNSSSRPDAQVKLQISTVPSANAYLKGPYAPSGASLGGSSTYQNGDGVNATWTGYGLGGYNPALPSMMEDHFGAPSSFENASAASAITSLGTDYRVFGGGVLSGSNINGPNNLSNFSRIGNHKAASALQMPLADPLFIQYLKSAGYAAQVASNYGNPSMERVGNPYMNLLEVQKACLGALLQSQEQYGLPFPGKPAALGHAYYEDPLFGLGATHPGKSLLVTPGLPGSPVGPGSPLRHGERRYPSGLRNFPGGTMGWHTDFNGGMEESFPCSLLEEFKSNKTRCFELSEIAGHIVEFSADQYGSRFIQQKLETATTAEKDMVYEEIMPQALSLMTDVFGNYVVQKFFEHGSAVQIRELANKLDGHVLALSLQMYGCRVIQKAIEVVDLDQKTKMVAELDGNVIRCVRDQNGNHVIQKCIECIPQDAIQFIVSTFYDQIVSLSTHPYGCRVVQRILEHCDNPETQQIVMDEIMRCICMLAQDQYGNYVVQHVLEHGKPNERSAIIEQLAGQIVQMSQQKFASNVVEKCLTFCGLEERQHLVNEMLGSTDENEPLQAMMKDQFGNYVVQKVLETCDDQQRELILTRIKIHLNALKKYTYGKHIVARVEKLVAAGERRIGLQNMYTSRTE